MALIEILLISVIHIIASWNVANFFRVRFDRLTALRQKYLRGMAQLGPGPYKTGDIAATLGVRAAAIAAIRQQLIDKGMVWGQRHGETVFTVPMFDVFMKCQIPEFQPDPVATWAQPAWVDRTGECHLPRLCRFSTHRSASRTSGQFFARPLPHDVERARLQLQNPRSDPFSLAFSLSSTLLQQPWFIA
jgi:hypothetical protein